MRYTQINLELLVVLYNDVYRYTTRGNSVVKNILPDKAQFHSKLGNYLHKEEVLSFTVWV